MNTEQTLEIQARFKTHNIRITQQRVILGELLFNGPCRHVTAEQIHAEINDRGEPLSLATVYNNLKLFSKNGLLQQVPLTPTLNVFDTNTAHHYHIYNESTGELIDAPPDIFKGQLQFNQLPENVELLGIDVVIRVR